MFGFYLRKKDYTKAEKYLSYFSNHDSMKKIYQGRLYQEQGRTEDAYEMYQNVIFSEYSKLNMAFSMMAVLANKNNDMEYAKFLAKKMSSLSQLLEMGKYNEYSPLFDIVCAEKDVEGTFQVVKQLLENVDSLYDFRKSKLYSYIKFKDIDGSVLEEVRNEIIEGCRDEEVFGYMKGYEPWEELVIKEYYP